LELGSDGKPGDELATYLHMPDTVLDIAITPNRGDCLSILGLAREIGALFGARIRMPRLRPGKVSQGPESEGYVPLTVEIRAREFETLDNVKRALDPSDLMIADREKPLAIAGVMGGLNSEVGDSTTSIILESAYFEPMTIARTARHLGLRSEASYRFERGIDR